MLVLDTWPCGACSRHPPATQQMSLIHLVWFAVVQVLETAEQYGVPLAGENALQRYDEHAFDRIAESAFGRTARAGVCLYAPACPVGCSGLRFPCVRAGPT